MLEDYDRLIAEFVKWLLSCICEVGLCSASSMFVKASIGYDR